MYRLLLILLALPGLAMAGAAGNAPLAPTTVAKTPGSIAVLSWSAPTLYDDGTPIGAQPLAYNVYAAAPGLPWQLAATGGGVLAITWSSPALARGTVCYTVTAFLGSMEGLHGPIACVNVPAGTPDPPPTTTVK